jgi:diaminopimelate decarboxylase
MILPEFVSRYWKANSDGELLIGGLKVSELSERHGTPLFVYDRNVLEKKYLAVRGTLPARFGICYSMKANPNPEVLKFFLERGCGLEIASLGEFHQAMQAGCPTKKILFAGPGKTETELEQIISQGIGEIHIESQLELDRISSISRKLNVCTPFAVRVNPQGEEQSGAMRMGGKSAAFGIDEESLDPVLLRIRDDPHLQFCGIHLFVGTQIFNHEELLAQYRKAIAIAKHASLLLAVPIRTVDFGGGWGIPYFSDDAELDLVQLATGLKQLMPEIEREQSLVQARFVLEPGRFLVGEAGVYVARINDIKMSRGKKYLILDGGMNHHLAASGNLGQVIKRNFPMAILNRLDAAADETVDVVGPLCTPLDTLGRSLKLPKAQVGDLIGIFQSGAYARSASPLGFLSHPSPPEVWIENGQDLLVRRRGRSDDYLRDVESISPAVQSLS